MTSRTPSQPAPTSAHPQFPTFPPRDNMQNSIYLDKTARQAALDLHFDNPDSTIIQSEIPVHLTPGPHHLQRIPDLLIAFNTDPQTAIQDNGYAIVNQGKPPDFVLEVASVSTGRNDYTGKRTDYAGFGIPEYWRFDPTGGQRHDAPLAGDRLMDGIYQPIPIIQRDKASHWGHSDVLALDLCWEEGQLRWWDPQARQYLTSLREERALRTEAQDRTHDAEARIAQLEQENRQLRGHF